MKNITSVFNATPFKNKTFNVYATIPSDERFISEDEDYLYYTPYFFASFAYDTRHDTKRNLHCIAHDIAHALDLWERGQEKRLLEGNFGWRIRPDGEKWPTNDIHKEMRTAVLQGFITQNLFGFDREQVFRSRQYIRTRIKPEYAPFLPTKKEYDDKVNQYKRHCHRVGFDKYTSMWQDLCQYVKENRE